MDLYIPGRTFIHRLHPAAKILGLVLLSASPLILDRPQPLLLANVVADQVGVARHRVPALGPGDNRSVSTRPMNRALKPAASHYSFCKGSCNSKICRYRPAAGVLDDEICYYRPVLVRGTMKYPAAGPVTGADAMKCGIAGPATGCGTMKYAIAASATGCGVVECPVAGSATRPGRASEVISRADGRRSSNTVDGTPRTEVAVRARQSPSSLILDRSSSPPV